MKKKFLCVGLILLISTIGAADDIIQQKIAELGSPHFQTREAATRYFLTSNPEKTLLKLKKALDETEVPEVAHRLDNILSTIHPDLTENYILYRVKQTVENSNAVKELTEIVQELKKELSDELAVTLKQIQIARGEALNSLAVVTSRIARAGKASEEEVCFLFGLYGEVETILRDYADVYSTLLKSLIDKGKVGNSIVGKRGVLEIYPHLDGRAHKLFDRLGLNGVPNSIWLPFSVNQRNYILGVTSIGNGFVFLEKPVRKTIPANEIFPRFGRFPNGRELRDFEFPDFVFDLIGSAEIKLNDKRTKTDLVFDMKSAKRIKGSNLPSEYFSKMKEVKGWWEE